MVTVHFLAMATKQNRTHLGGKDKFALDGWSNAGQNEGGWDVPECRWFEFRNFPGFQKKQPIMKEDDDMTQGTSMPERRMPRSSMPLPSRKPCPRPTLPPGLIGSSAAPEKSAAVAVLLHFLIPGSGYFYLGNFGIGLVFLLFSLFTVGAAFAANVSDSSLWGLYAFACSVVLLVFHIVAICDMVKRCNNIKKAREEAERLRRWKERQNKKTCPFCGESIRESAILCRFCGSRLDEGDGIV